MRASRLLSILLLLQTRGRMTAEALAAEFEVSVRTIYRDIDQLSAAGAPVYFHGHVAGRSRLAARLAAADVSLSVCPGETFGLSVLEALACGTPVVATRVGGLSRAIFHGRTGLLVDGHHAADWADALEALYDDPATREDMGRAAAIRAQNSGWARTAGITLESYHAAVDNHLAHRLRPAVPAS